MKPHTRATMTLLYRVPLPIGLGTSAPTPLLPTATIAAAITEDASYVYWIDSVGGLYKCAASNRAGTKTIVTSGQQVTGHLFQDATYLYWGTYVLRVKSCAWRSSQPKVDGMRACFLRRKAPGR